MLAELGAAATLAQRVSSLASSTRLGEETVADSSEVSKAINMDSWIGSIFLGALVGFKGSWPAREQHGRHRAEGHSGRARG